MDKIIKKVRRFFDFIIDLVSKPIFKYDAFCNRDLTSPLQVLFTLLGYILGLPFVVVLGILCFLLSILRDIITGSEA